MIARPEYPRHVGENVDPLDHQEGNEGEQCLMIRGPRDCIEEIRQYLEERKTYTSNGGSDSVCVQTIEIETIELRETKGKKWNGCGVYNRAVVERNHREDQFSISESWGDEDISSVGDSVGQKVDAVIDELRQNWRVEHPTKYEKILKLFLDGELDPISEETLQALYDNVETSPEQRVSTEISRLNKKLEKRGLRIDSRKVYCLTSLGDKTAEISE